MNFEGHLTQYILTENIFDWFHTSQSALITVPFEYSCSFFMYRDCRVKGLELSCQLSFLTRSQGFEFYLYNVDFQM